MEGKTWTLMRPWESFSIFSAHGIRKCFIGLATGGMNECRRSVTSCAAAGAAAMSASPDRNVARAAQENLFMRSTLPADDDVPRYGRPNFARTQSRWHRRCDATASHRPAFAGVEAPAAVFRAVTNPLDA